jgi:hypothetical protein
MMLDFSVPGQVTVPMIDYIKMICMDLLMDMIGKAATLAANHLIRVDDENAAPLNKDRACRPVRSSNNAAAVSKPKDTSRYPNSNFIPMQAPTSSKRP